MELHHTPAEYIRSRGYFLTGPKNRASPDGKHELPSDDRDQAMLPVAPLRITLTPISSADENAVGETELPTLAELSPALIPNREKLPLPAHKVIDTALPGIVKASRCRQCEELPR